MKHKNPPNTDMASFSMTRLKSPVGSSAKAGRSASVNRKLKRMKVELNWIAPKENG